MISYCLYQHTHVCAVHPLLLCTDGQIFILFVWCLLCVCVSGIGAELNHIFVESEWVTKVCVSAGAEARSCANVHIITHGIHTRLVISSAVLPGLVQGSLKCTQVKGHTLWEPLSNNNSGKWDGQDSSEGIDISSLKGPTDK